ncbi:DUF1799 domain-containing protein [Spongiibacter sp. UBA1325]|uniref:DUF1799 domain-containing protein n=1 Tax=Spongiibacter sp. UBA1325 TaxID=1947543 RepID=UPI00257CC3F4|nr:DUF1799 domain-containing protein [Spongiibacter sp. UBA1325]|tara:strand:+ start:2391 stop:2708 length:318 start_codon:yes stop_codon:yes gene_type:complete
MGASEADLAWLDEQAQQAAAGIVIYEQNWPVFTLFLACSRQWLTTMTPDGKLLRLGLDWAQVEVRARYLPELRGLNQANTDQLWHDLNTLQHHALETFAEQHEQH